MEYIREFKIILYIDTNKQTIKKEFKTPKELIEYLENLEEELGFSFSYDDED